MSTEQHRLRGSRSLAGIASVAIIGAGLGAFFGIRAAEGAGSAAQAGQPSARTGAAMAFDAADGSVVFFGGQSRARSLDDTWTWDGSRWTQAHPATSPPALDNAQMSYDPVSRDVILVGEAPVVGFNHGEAVCSTGSGSASSSSSGSAITRIAPGNPIPAASPIPMDTPVPTATARPGPPILTLPPDCHGVPSPKPATWLWNGSDWSKSAASTPDAVFGGSTLAIDPVSGRAVLLTRGPFAEPALGAAQPAIACPVQKGSQPMCPPPFRFSPGWSWNGHQWKVMASNASNSSFDVAGSSIVDDAVSGRLATFGGDFIAPLPQPLPCEGCVSPPVRQSTCGTGTESIPVTQSACGTGTVRIWNGTSWKLQATFRNGPPTPGVSFAGDPATHSDVLLTGDGQTWLWTGTWTRLHPGTTPPIVSGAASAYDASSGQVVIFGGFGSSAHESGLYDQTWTWNGSDWSRRGGSARPAVIIPVPSPVGAPPGRPCLPVAIPAQVLDTPPSVPSTVCKGSTGVVSGGTASAAAGSPASVVIAP